MTDTTTTQAAGRLRQPDRLIRRLERSDAFLMRAIQAAALIGCILGVMIYAWQAIASDIDDRQHALNQAASAGQVAAEAELARINSVLVEITPLLTTALAPDATAATRRDVHAALGERLTSGPVMAIATFGTGASVTAVFGDLPADASGALSAARSSKRAGRELMPLELVPLAHGRIANYRALTLGDGRVVQVALVLRTSSFSPALDIGAAAGDRWRAALLNRDGDVIKTAPDATGILLPQDTDLAAVALGWAPLHADEASARDRTSGRQGGTFLEARSVAGDQLQVVYIGQARSAFAVLASHRYEFMALFGASMLGILLAVSIIQNEWQRQDKDTRNADLAAARADITCDLLSAGVIDWSVQDATVSYSDGWADMFAQGDEPRSEQIFDWVSRIHPEDRLAAREAYQRVLDGADVELVHRIRIRLATGLWVRVIERGRALIDANGQIVRIVLVQTAEPSDGRELRDFVGAAVKKTSRTA
ncbi:PAS domain-containing protein [Hyphomonas johnsonii]|uniref:Multi-sensor hybrid histidine kinase n=1 Tax=Hyphomonas johnsonii MHS-2 TaxID=1280950 RepID=A0A059FP55_9PROT|nr:PAS domain-containing protein [Hyphomonas johnsonii]KCZ92248.1 multi-sensor hybrid histidine kinase [Hyphomonas johnsonii MHS-2]